MFHRGADIRKFLEQGLELYQSEKRETSSTALRHHFKHISPRFTNEDCVSKKKTFDSVSHHVSLRQSEHSAQVS